MADIARVKIAEDALPVAFTFAAGATAGKTIDFNGEDEKTVILFNNTGTAAANVTITAGGGIQGATDLVVSVPVGYSAMVLESGVVKQVTGDKKGTVIISGAATVTMAAVELR